MKRYFAITGIALALCSLAPAQEPQRVVIPARNSTRPRVIKATMLNAGITVKTHAGKDVIVESSTPAPRRREERTPDGLRRIDIPAGGFSVEEQDNVITVSGSHNTGGVLTLTVPVDTSVDLKTVHGPLVVEGLHGEVVVSSTNSPITVTNISGTVVAETVNGAIKVSMDRVDPAKPISFSSTNGQIEVALPADLKANLKMRSYNGSIWTDYDMTVAGGKPQTTSGGANGKFEVRYDRTTYGTINGGGVEASFSTLNGRIVIKKKS